MLVLDKVSVPFPIFTKLNVVALPFVMVPEKVVDELSAPHCKTLDPEVVDVKLPVPDKDP